jgi:DNA-binding response OmpR family regulator
MKACSARMRLLVVEDDSGLVAALQEGLRGRGFAVDHTASAERALDLLRVNPYDLVTLDLGLPGMDGMAMLRALRANGNAIPVLVLTARGEVVDRVGGLDAGADDYLQKPFAFAELLARIRALLRRRGSVAVAPLRVADLELDAARFAASRAGSPLTLTAKEFSILEYFMLHAGELVTRTMLLDHCWDESYEGLSNLVDVHVSRVRRKVDVPGRKPLFQTIRGAGFILGERVP